MDMQQILIHPKTQEMENNYKTAQLKVEAKHIESWE